MGNFNMFIAGVLAIILSGAPGSFAQTDPRIDKAKEERAVLIYGSTQLDQINAVIKHFAQKYSFISVNYSRLVSEGEAAEKIDVRAVIGNISRLRAGWRLCPPGFRAAPQSP